MNGIDWQSIFLPSVPVLESVIRATIMYLVLFFFLRITLRRVGGTFGLGDILLVALIAAASQNAIAREERSVTDAIISVATITFWSYALDWLGYRFPRFQRIYSPPPLLLVKNGVMLRKNMRTELITEDELMTEMRRHGILNLKNVKEAYLEGDGHITMIERVE
jgi:uncharacterized membrane protein YcaP (DUF421 family)